MFRPRLCCVFAGLLVSGPQLLAQGPPRGALTQEEENNPILRDIIGLLNTPVTVASNVMSDRSKQPVSMTTVTRNQIQLSGARTLNEVIGLYVPGFFMVEDQDDNIAGFRGIAPDNNSKVMFLLNGHVLNTEWFWGPPDAMLNGIDLDYIERIEVIRGPGSVTLGQGALLGVINVITRVGTHRGQSFTAGGGPNKGWMTVMDSSAQEGRLRSYLHLGILNDGGQEIRPEGNATRDWEGLVGGKVYAAGNRNHRARNLTGLFSLEYGDLSLDALHTDQKRDIYNFRRDRSQYTQVLDSLAAKQVMHFGPDHSLEFKASLAQDDYELHSNLGYAMGGTRENRQSLGITYKAHLGPWNLALGTELKRFQMGRRNADGNNFIVNRVGPDLLDSPNTRHQWVYPKDISLQSLFGEAFWALSSHFDLFGAFRFDQHPFWGSMTSPRLGVLYSPGPTLNFRASYQSGFRGAPGVHYSGGFQGDGLLREENFGKIHAATQGRQPDLQKVEPESSRSLELQGVWQPTPSLRLEVVAFQNRVDHIIGFGSFSSGPSSPVPDTIGSDQKGDWDGYWYYQNTQGSFTTQGLELALSWHGPRVEVGLSHSLVKVAQADLETRGSLYLTPASLGKHVRGYPEQVSRLNLTYLPSATLTASLNLLSWGRWYTSGPSGPGQTLLNGALRARLGEQATLTLSVSNLFDTRGLYPFTDVPADSASDPRPGTPSLLERTWWIKAGWQF